MLARLARWSFRRRKLMVFGIWLPLLIGLSVVSGAVGTGYSTSFDLPPSEARDVQDILTSGGSAEEAGDVAQIVFTAPQGTDDPEVVAAMTTLFDEVAKIPGLKVTSPYSPEGAQFNSRVAPISFAQLSFAERDQAGYLELSEQIQALDDGIRVQGLTIEYGGQLFATFEFPESELLGILAAIFILLIAFGSVLAMGLPIGTALFGLGVGFGHRRLGSNGISMPEFGPQMAAMIGLGVGIDYALFIVTRYRENLHDGMRTPRTATVEAVDTSGRAVMFAGITVMISLLGLFIMGLAFVRGLAVAGATGVLVMMIAAITLLPALLGFTGTRIEVTTRAAAGAVSAVRVVRSSASHRRQPRPAAGHRPASAHCVMGAVLSARSAARCASRCHTPRSPASSSSGIAGAASSSTARGRRSRRRRRADRAVAAAVRIRLGFGDERQRCPRTPPPAAYDLLADGFGPGSNGPLFLGPHRPGRHGRDVGGDASTPRSTGQRQHRVRVARRADRRGHLVWQVYPTSAPQDEATAQLVSACATTCCPPPAST
jgi:RND superfamily putative drug exporter